MKERLLSLILTLTLILTLILPAAAQTADPAEAFPIFVDGKEIAAMGAVMVPARAVAESLGFTVTWLGNGRFTLKNDVRQTTVTWGEDAYFVTPTGAGILGASSFSLGVPPFCVNGVSYVPLKLFDVLTGNVEGTFRFDDGEIRIETGGRQYSSSTLILTFRETATEQEITELFDRYDLKLLYAYRSLGNLYAVTADDAAAAGGLDALIEKLEREEIVLAAEKDSVVSITDHIAVDGGWSRAESPVVTEETKILLKKATDGMVGADYTPVAYLGSQIVAGRNHAILCRITPVVPNPVAGYGIVRIFEDLNGNAKITGVDNAAVTISFQDAPGGWYPTGSPELPAPLKTGAAIALRLAKTDYVPVALLGEQIVAGKKYFLLCAKNAGTSAAGSGFAFATLFEDLYGNLSITQIMDFLPSGNADG